MLLLLQIAGNNIFFISLPLNKTKNSVTETFDESKVSVTLFFDLFSGKEIFLKIYYFFLVLFILDA